MERLEDHRRWRVSPLSLFRTRQAERIYPFAGGAIAGGVWFWLGPSFPKDSIVLVASLTLAAIFTGFLSTALSVLLGLDSPVMKRLRATSFRWTLVAFLRDAMVSNLLFGALAVAGLFMDKPPHWFGVLWCALLTMMVLAFVRILDVLMGLLQHPIE